MQVKEKASEMTEKAEKPNMLILEGLEKLNNNRFCEVINDTCTIKQ